MYRKMKKILFPIVLGCAFVAVSCEDKLDIPQKGTVSTLEFYASDADAEAAITDMYANFVANVAGSEGIDNPEQVIINYASDDILAAGGHISDHDGFRGFDEFDYDEANGTLKSAYDRYTGAIYHANLVISNFSTENRKGAAPKFESEYTKKCVEEARVMRAYLHMMLAILWNQPAIIDRLLDPDELPVQAESQKQVFDWVIAECDKAINSGYLLKRNGKTDKDATARMTIGFAQFVAGKAAMFNNDPATARKYLEPLVNNTADYDLVESSEYWTNFHVAGDGNCEKIFEPNFIYDANAPFWDNVWRSRWMVADVFCWRTDHLASMPSVCPAAGWNGGAIQEDFAKKFLEHDGNSPRRRACFLTADEWLYEMEWNSKVNFGTMAEMEADSARGISLADGIYSHGPYFEWKHMAYAKAPKILAGDKTYPADNVMDIMGGASTQKNFNCARLAEALLLYAEACVGSSDAAKGLAALNRVQTRSGSGKISSELTFEAVMEEKQYEMWFENCRFPDIVRWINTGKLNLDDVIATYHKIHENIPTVYDKFYTQGTGKHELYVGYSKADYQEFDAKHMYLPFPRDARTANHFKNVLGWESLNSAEAAAE